MSDLDPLWDTISTRVTAVPAVTALRRPAARAAITALLVSDDLADRSPGSPVLVQSHDQVTAVEINIGVQAEVSAAATGLAVGWAVVEVLDEAHVGAREIVVRVLSVGP